MGKTSRPKRRWYEHIRASTLPGNPGHGYLQRSIAKYGKDAFRFEIIDTTMTEPAAYRAEQVWIEHLNCKAPGGFNLDGGGQGPSNPSLQTIAKMSTIAKERWVSNRDRMSVPPSFAGRRHSPEAIEKIRAARRKQASPRLGMETPPETRRRLSDSNKKTWSDPEFRMKHGRLVSSKMAEKRDA